MVCNWSALVGQQLVGAIGGSVIVRTVRGLKLGVHREACNWSNTAIPENWRTLFGGHCEACI